MKAQTQKEMGAGARYKANIAKKKAALQLVEVYPPSGELFIFEKPSKFSMLFGAGQLPLSATNGAIEKWQGDGIMGDEEAAQSNQMQLIKAAMTVRDKVLRLSHTPKLVVGLATNDNELSTDDVDDDDLDYLFKWVAAGGEVSAMLGNFPGGSQPSPLASASRKKQRIETELVSGD